MAEYNQQFATFEEWVNKASSWLTHHPEYGIPTFRALCFDAKGRVCASGKEFHRARDENAFPVSWYWPDQITAMATFLRYVAAIDVSELMRDYALGELDLISDMGDLAQRAKRILENGEDERPTNDGKE